MYHMIIADFTYGGKPSGLGLSLHFIVIYCSSNPRSSPDNSQVIFFCEFFFFLLHLSIIKGILMFILKLFFRYGKIIYWAKVWRSVPLIAVDFVHPVTVIYQNILYCALNLCAKCWHFLKCFV